jgi:hypothetical protein
LADGIERACHGAQVGFEGFVSHSSSYLIARKSGCTIIPDSGILWMVASMQPEWREASRWTDPLAPAEMQYESQIELSSDFDKWRRE